MSYVLKKDSISYTTQSREELFKLRIELVSKHLGILVADIN